MSQVSVARQPESWLPNQIAVWPIRWRTNELVFSITCEPSISRKLYNCYKVAGLQVASPGMWTMFLSGGDVLVCILEASERCVCRRHPSWKTEKSQRYTKQVTSWWTSDPKLFLQTRIGKHAPRSQQNLAAHVRQNLLLHNHCTHRATETWLM